MRVTHWAGSSGHVLLCPFQRHLPFLPSFRVAIRGLEVGLFLKIRNCEASCQRNHSRVQYRHFTDLCIHLLIYTTHIEQTMTNSAIFLQKDYPKQDGKPIKWTCDEEMALGCMHIVA